MGEFGNLNTHPFGINHRLAIWRVIFTASKLLHSVPETLEDFPSNAHLHFRFVAPIPIVIRSAHFCADDFSKIIPTLTIVVVTHHSHTGKLSCFLAGISTFFSRSMASPRAMRRRVECGLITSSI